MEEKKIDIEELKKIYDDCVEYLKNKEELDRFQNKLEHGADKYKAQCEKEQGLNDLSKERDMLYKTLEKYEDLKSKGVYDDYDDYDDEFENFTEKQIEEYFDYQKKCQLLERKIKLLENKINEEYFDFREKKQEENQKEVDALKQKVLASGAKIIDIEEIKSQNERKYDMRKIEDMLLENKYSPVTFKGQYQEDYEKADYSTELVYWNHNLNNWFGCLPYENIMKLTTKKLSHSKPSAFEYFVDALEKHTGKKYKRVNIVTNQTSCWHDHYEPDDYVVYCATLLVPENLAEAFVMSEKKQTSKSIEKFVENHNDVILLNDKNIIYYTEDYHPIWGGSKKQNDAEWKRYKDASKFNDKYREEVRKKLSQDEESNTIDIEKLFSVDDNDYDYGYGHQLVGDMPSTEMAEAAFDAIEYVVKLNKLAKLEKLVDKHNEHKKAVEEYDELLKSM